MLTINEMNYANVLEIHVALDPRLPRATDNQL